MELDYLHAVALGVLQALTEFLPVSSSGHLAVVQKLMHLDPKAPAMLLFDVATHLGTLLAVLWVFAPQVRRFLSRLVRETRGQCRRFDAWRITALGVCASIPTAAIGLKYKDRFESAFDQPRVIAAGLVVTALLLGTTHFLKRGRRGWRRFDWWRATLIGVAQGFAVLPGVSRSGSTICIALLLGIRRRWAAEFSFFIAAPAIVGAALLKLKDTLDLPAADLEALPWGPVAAGTLVAVVVGYGALRLLLGVVRRAKLHYFAVYCLIAAAGVLALSHMNTQAVRAEGTPHPPPLASVHHP